MIEVGPFSFEEYTKYSDPNWVDIPNPKGSKKGVNVKMEQYYKYPAYVEHDT